MKTIMNFNPKDKFISIDVYKFPLGNCGGITDVEKKVWIPCKNGPYIFEDIQRYNETNLIFVEQQRSEDYWALIPVEQTEGMVGPMSGGNLAYSSDSRCR
jgi:hypothetical protein